MNKHKLRESIRRIIKEELAENSPAPSKPKETPGPAVAPGKPGQKPGPRRPLGNPDVKPKPKAKATIDEAEMLAKVIKRFKSKQPMNEAGKTWAEGYEGGYNEGFKDASNGKSNKFKK
jgi:hypothetical protein